MGTSNRLTDINLVFESILKQLEMILKIDENGHFQNQEFIDKLSFISEKYLKHEKLLIILDSIDQLSNEKLKFHWLLNILPKNVKIIYSVTNDSKNGFMKFKKQVKSENILEIQTIKSDEAIRTLSFYLISSNRQLTKTQTSLVNEMVYNLKDISQLQIKLISDITSKWKSSFSVPKSFLNCKTSIDLIKYIFEKIQNEIFSNNEILFKHCLFYLTIFEFRGISETELEEILSIDDHLLSSIFIENHPSVRRFPMALWYRFKYELKDYVTTRIDDDYFIAWLV